jgi:flagellar hook-associated protein 3
MRVTNKMLSNNFLRDMRTNLNNMNTLQGQMSSGKEIRKPSDDPFKASRIMQMHSDIDANKQYKSNIKDSINWLDTTDTALGQVGNVVGRIEELLISAGNGAYDKDERTAIKDEINQKIGEISQILNTSFDGKYIFGGASGTDKPMETKPVGENTELVCNIKPKVVTKLTAGAMTSASNLNGDMSGVTFGIDKFNIDGQEITVNWDTTLTAEQKAEIKSSSTVASDSTLDSIKDIFVNTINSAIDASGKGISHISGYLKSTITTPPATDKSMVLQSGSTGTQSQVTLTSGDSTSIGAKILSNTAGAVSTTPNVGTNIYIGKTVSKDAEFNMTLNGVKMLVKTTADITSGETKMSDMAKILEDSINANITVVSDKVQVTAADGGRFEINSPSGTITFSDDKGTISKDLGLSQGPDMLLVEVSQGVTMDYNINATQVLNYGDNPNENLMKLLSDITTHLDAKDPADPNYVADIKALTNTDLGGIKSVMTNILKLRSQVGAKQNRMESAESRNIDLNFNMMEILSRTEDIDITEKTMEYATMQTIYMASLQTSAKVLQPSLLDYLR